MIANIVGLIILPKQRWKIIAERDEFNLLSAMLYVMLLAVVPCLAFYYGTTQVGWTVGDGEVIKLTVASAKKILVLFYLAMVLSICAIGFMIHWMADTYGCDSSTAKGISVAGFAATPLFIAGAIGFTPVFWLALIISIVAVCDAVYLLYSGITSVMKIPEERGFLFASAVIAVCLVILTIIMGGSVILWDMGAAPVFTD